MKKLFLKWHPEAINDLNKIVFYCFQMFGKIVAERVGKNIVDKGESLNIYPYLGKVESSLIGCTSLEYRSLLVSEFTKLIYTVHTDFIYIHLLWDVRQDEKNIKRITLNRYKTANPTHLSNEPIVEYIKTE